jgi:hypothetical protein
MPKLLLAFRGPPGFQGTQSVKDLLANNGISNYMMRKKLLRIISQYNPGTRLERMRKMTGSLREDSLRI